MSISPLRCYNSERTFSINNVEGESLRALRGLDVEEGCPLSAGPEHSSGWRCLLHSLRLSVCITGLKKKIYSVIKYRAITLQVKNSHRAERWVSRLPRRPYEARIQKGICSFELSSVLSEVLLSSKKYCVWTQTSSSLPKSLRKGRLCVLLPWEFQPPSSPFGCLFLFLRLPTYPLNFSKLDSWKLLVPCLQLCECWTTERHLGSREAVTILVTKKTHSMTKPVSDFKKVIILGSANSGPWAKSSLPPVFVWSVS